MGRVLATATRSLFSAWASGRWRMGRRPRMRWTGRSSSRLELGRLGLELRGEEVADCKAAIGPPALGELQYLRLGRHLVEAVDVSNGPAECEVTRQDNIATVEGDDQKAMYCPRTDARDRGERRLDLLVGGLQKGLVAELTSGEPLSEGA